MSENVARVSLCVPSNIQAQIEARRAGRRKKVFHGGLLCSCCLETAPDLPDRYCHDCRNKYSAQRKRDERAELKRLRQLHEAHE